MPGPVEFDTSVGPVSAVLGIDGTVTIRNVPAYVYLRDVSVEVPGLGTVVGVLLALVLTQAKARRLRIQRA